MPYYSNQSKGGNVSQKFSYTKGSYSNHSNYKQNSSLFESCKTQIMWWVGGFILTFFLLWVIKQIYHETFSRPAILDEFFKKPPKLDKVKGESKGETLCREVATKVFGKSFKKIRPDFLKNNVTGHNLELDIYNEELKVAIEYNGQQHYKYVPFFHKNYEHFLNQKYRDEIKKMLCKQEGIYLIEISYETDPTDIETTIRLEALKLGFHVDTVEDAQRKKTTKSSK